MALYSYGKMTQVQLDSLEQQQQHWKSEFDKLTQCNSQVDNDRHHRPQRSAPSVDAADR